MQGAARGLPGVSPGPGPRPLCCWLAASALGVPQDQPHYGDFPLPARSLAHAEPPQIPSAPLTAPSPSRGAAVPTCGGRAGAASPGPASGSRRHGYGCTSAVRDPPALTDPDGRTRGCGPRDPLQRDMAPRTEGGHYLPLPTHTTYTPIPRRCRDNPLPLHVLHPTPLPTISCAPITTLGPFNPVLLSAFGNKSLHCHLNISRSSIPASHTHIPSLHPHTHTPSLHAYSCLSPPS